MALTTPLIVRIEKRQPGSFGDVMNDIRSWLDHHKIEPALFKQIGEDGFEIGFDSEEAARLFERAFCQPIIFSDAGAATLPGNDFR